MARMNEQIFKCQCPVFDCNNTRLNTWHHYDHPFDNLYISDRAILRCDGCGMQEEFFNCKYDCGYHGDQSESARFRFPTNLKRVLAVIGALEDDGIYSADFVDSLAESLRQQFRKKFR
jgi:hypothetical protein